MLLNEQDDYVLLVKLSDFIPGRPCKSTIFRWADLGVLDGSGKRVKLKTYRIGGRILARLSDLKMFLDTLNADRTEQPAESEAEIARRGREAGKALEALGC